MIAPQHAVSTWIGHSMKVSEKHYLQVTDEMYALVTKKKVANSLQSTSVKASQRRSGNDHADYNQSLQTAVNTAETAISANGPGRIRTCDRAIMSRRSHAENPEDSAPSVKKVAKLLHKIIPKGSAKRLDTLRTCLDTLGLPKDEHETVVHHLRNMAAMTRDRRDAVYRLTSPWIDQKERLYTRSAVK